jgi:hypothetical protein
VTLQADLDLAASLYTQLAARVLPGRQLQGRRVPPTSRPPLQVDMVSHMAALEQALAWWINQARWLLDPVSKVELTRTTGVRCPHCGADLVAWLRPAAQDQSEIVCTSQDPDHEGQRRWQPAEWKRLGVLVGVHEDGRFGARLSGVAVSVSQSP